MENIKPFMADFSKMVVEKVEGQIVQKMSFKFRLANHSDEPPKSIIVSAMASTMI